MHIHCRIFIICVGKGGNKRKKAKNLGLDQKRELIFKEEGQEYAQVLRMLGKVSPGIIYVTR